MSEGYEHKDILNRLSEMQDSPYYATARKDLFTAEMTIIKLERERDELRAKVKEIREALKPKPDISEIDPDWLDPPMQF